MTRNSRMMEEEEEPYMNEFAEMKAEEIAQVMNTALDEINECDADSVKG